MDSLILDSDFFGLSLSLFVFWLLAYYTYDTFTTDDDTLITDFLDGWSDFHKYKCKRNYFERFW